MLQVTFCTPVRFDNNGRYTGLIERYELKTITIPDCSFEQMCEAAFNAGADPNKNIRWRKL